MHYTEKQRKYLFRFALGCWGTVLGISAFGYTLKPSFRVKDSVSEFSDHKIRDRLRQTYWHLLAGFAIMGVVVLMCMRNPEWRRSLYAFGDDEVFAGCLTLGIPAYFTAIYTKPENTALLYISTLVFWLSMGFAQVSALIVPGVLYRRGLWPMMSMLTSISLTCSAAPNPWYMQNFSVINGTLGMGAGWAIAHALYGRHYKQFEIFFHILCWTLGVYLAFTGVHEQVSHAMTQRVYPVQAYPLSFFTPVPILWTHEIREARMQKRGRGQRAGGKILENPFKEEDQDEDYEKELYRELQRVRQTGK